MSASGGHIEPEEYAEFTTEISGKFQDGVDIIDANSLNNFQKGILYNKAYVDTTKTNILSRVADRYVPISKTITIGNNTPTKFSEELKVNISNLGAFPKAINDPQTGYYIKYGTIEDTSGPIWTQITPSGIGAIKNPATDGTTTGQTLVYNASATDNKWEVGTLVNTVNSQNGAVVLEGEDINTLYSQYSGSGTVYNTVTKTVKDAINDIITVTNIEQILTKVLEE